MDRLLNIDRPGGFPQCAETLGILDENSMMLEALLREIDLDRRRAAEFGQYMLVCDQNGQKRVVKKNVETATSRDQCKLVFCVTNYPVHDSEGNTIPDVWKTETADIVDESDSNKQWTILSIQEVLREVWRDLTPEFIAALPGISITNNGDIESNPILKYDYGNVVRVNSDRLQLKFAMRLQIKAYLMSHLSIPMPAEVPDGVRVEVDIENSNNGTYYATPAHARTKNGNLIVFVGHWMKQNNMITGFADCNTINGWFYVNREVVL